MAVDSSKIIPKHFSENLSEKYSGNDFDYDVMEGEAENYLGRAITWFFNRMGDIFGFHLAKLDFRQHSKRHLSALDEITERLEIFDKPYSELEEEEKLTWLLEELNSKRPLIPGDLHYSEDTNQTIEVFRTMAALQDKHGSRALDTYIVSMTTNASDMLHVLLLAKECGLFNNQYFQDRSITHVKLLQSLVLLHNFRL